MKKIVLLAFSMLLVSCSSFLNSKPASALQHTLVKNSCADALWSRNDVTVFIDDNMPMLASGPNRIIVSGIQPKKLYAFDSVAGKLVWEQDNVLPDTLAVNNLVLYMTNLNNVQAYDIMSGNNIWNVQLPSSDVFTSLNFLEDRMFAYSSNGGFFILDANGKILESKGPNLYPMPYIVGDVTYAGNNKGIIAFDTITEKTIWQINVRGPFYSGLYFLDDAIYFRTGGSTVPGKVYAFSKNTGELLWKYDSDAISNVYGVGPNLYFLDLDGYLIGVDRKTGLQVAKLEFSPRPFMLPTAGLFIGGYYVTGDSLNNVLIVSIGDSSQLFALQIKNQ